LTLPYTQDWDFNLQRSFGSDCLFEIGYVGIKGTRLPRFIEANPAVFVPGTLNGQRKIRVAHTDIFRVGNDSFAPKFSRLGGIRLQTHGTDAATAASARRRSSIPAAL
jgi:hypothetical protein